MLAGSGRIMVKDGKNYELHGLINSQLMLRIIFQCLGNPVLSPKHSKLCFMQVTDNMYGKK